LDGFKHVFHQGTPPLGQEGIKHVQGILRVFVFLDLVGKREKKLELDFLENFYGKCLFLDVGGKN